MHQESDVGLNPGTPGSGPGPKAGAKPLRQPGIPLPWLFEPADSPAPLVSAALAAGTWATWASGQWGGDRGQSSPPRPTQVRALGGRRGKSFAPKLGFSSSDSNRGAALGGFCSTPATALCDPGPQLLFCRVGWFRIISQIPFSF